MVEDFLREQEGGGRKKRERKKQNKDRKKQSLENILRECRTAKAKESNNVQCCENCVNLLQGDICV